ncbi:MAG: FecR family protein [Bacteroides sp.]
MSKYKKQLISYFFKHEVSDEMKTKFHRYLLAQRNSNETNDELKYIWDSLDQMDTDTKTTNEAYQSIASRLFANKPPHSRFHWLRIAAVWFLPILLFGTSCYLFTQLREQRDIIATADICSLSAAYGERDSLVLSDGSKVWLNSGSTIVYPSTFLYAERKVALVGEAFFEVQKDKKPFVVDVDGMTVEVLGTSFNIASYPSDSQVTTTLESGRIAACINDNPNKYLLNPNDQLVYNRETGYINISQVNTHDFSSWRNGTLSISDTPFKEIAEMLERIYNVKIHILNETYNEQTIHAEFKYDDEIRDVMEVIKILIPGLTYTICKQNIYIK